MWSSRACRTAWRRLTSRLRAPSEMATSTDPLAREQIGVVARLPTARVTAPASNSALDLAQALANVTPEAQQAMAQYADSEATRVRESARRDAIETSGAQLADAVRQGQLKPTQNPWYIQS